MNVLMNPRKNILPASGMLQVLWSPEITETEKETIVLKHMKKNLVKRRWKQASAMRHVVEFVKGKEWTESHMKKIKKGDKETHNKLVHSAGQNDAEVGATNVENENIENDSNVDGEVEV
ncbi:uncharacterized protein LOC135483978 [Lineus longissimus]|uniref:uncharacterized protein LOC135483978 n=1 Tax=Lineus longissimus TaxID=88925 RepID=UPI00315CD504